jgi:hypothetical protein
MIGSIFTEILNEPTTYTKICNSIAILNAGISPISVNSITLITGQSLSYSSGNLIDVIDVKLNIQAVSTDVFSVVLTGVTTNI